MSKNTIESFWTFLSNVSAQFDISCECALTAKYSLIVECEIVRNVKVVIEIARDYAEFMKLARCFYASTEFHKKKESDYTDSDKAIIIDIAEQVARSVAECVGKFVYLTNGKCLEAAMWYKDYSVESTTTRHFIGMRVCDALLNSNLEDRHLPPFSIGYWK
jgi:hypothetical protein